MEKLSLNNNWCIRSSDSNHCFYSDVPATVVNTLFLNGQIQDPYYGENEWDTYEVLKKDYVFTNTFTVPAALLQNDQVLLRCEGIDTAAEIFLNEQHIAFVENMHRTYDFDVKELLVPGENQIRIYFHSNIGYVDKLRKANPYANPTITFERQRFLRKADYSYGWDWGPTMPDIGIWKDISIVAYSKARFEDVYIRQHHADGQVAVQIDYVLNYLSNNEAANLEIEITAPNGTKTAKVIQNAKNEDTCVFEIHDPQLWWCVGFGQQPLYNVALRLKAEDKLLEERTYRIGLRTLTVRREKDQWGESFEFCLNGISIFAMGANYIPEDIIYPRCNRELSKKLIEQCVKANHNCIRVWGGAYYREDYFYDLCDEYGLIVWHDLLFACAVYRVEEKFVEQVVAETKDNIRRLRHHASIALWCGNNEMEWGWNGLDMQFGDLPVDRADYIKLFEWILPRTVKSVDPDRFYWVASPSSGGNFDYPNDETRGDVHYWETWHQMKHYTEYRKYFFRFCSEFGFQSFPSVKTIRTFAEEKDMNIFSPVMENHQKDVGANGLILFFISANFRYPTKFESLIYASQLLQAEAIRFGVEHWRSNRGRCMGSIYWQLNDCWPVASWSGLDYYHRWKPLHYYSKRFYAPLLLAAQEDEGVVKFTISNETMDRKNTKVIWRLRENTGKILTEGSVTQIVEPLSACVCVTADFSHVIKQEEMVSFGLVGKQNKLARSQYLEYILLCDGVEVSRETLLFCRPKHFHFLDPKITYTVEETQDAFKLTLYTENYAKYVFLESPDFDFVASENCIDLSAGESRTIEILKRDITVNREHVQISREDLQKMNVMSVYDIA